MTEQQDTGTEVRESSRPGYKDEPSGPHSTMKLADHVFKPDRLDSRNSAERLMAEMNSARWARSETVEVNQMDLWVTLERLARAEQTIEDKISRLHDRGEHGWSSTARVDLEDQIVQCQRDAHRYCVESSEAAGMPWTQEGLENVTATYVVGALIALGWLPEDPKHKKVSK